MSKNVFLLAMIVCLTLLASLCWAGPQMKPGKWEITTKTEMAGMPAQSSTHVQCITGDDLVPMDRNQGQQCQVTDVKTIGNTVSWKITCKGQGGEMTGTGEITYEGDHMQGSMEMTIPGYGSQIKNTLSGHRIGPCD